MFGRFTDGAIQVLALAEEEARMLKHTWIATEHILLGLLGEEDGLAGRALEGLGVSVEHVRSQVVQIVDYGEEVTLGPFPFTPRTTTLLELAVCEAHSLRHDCVGSEHVLLGLVRENQGVAAYILLALGADSEKVRDAVMRAL